ncbi:NEDD4-binding protein 2-like 2 [Caerostris extrusa]|uniref:NEDD4-binding protein 2-like 2 n=1 Tax=Caerostris extrusa TaxID=172846 RepID=A0AAV4NDS4_CAEEX|nr:NEDD4-binding protein 2-like 2 [Caerostris extrusa]
MQKSILEKNPPVKNQIYKAEMLRNSSAVYDDMDPHQSVEYLIDIFKGKVDRDVIEMMFSECCLNVEETVESLMKLVNEEEKEINNNQSGYFDKSSSTPSLKKENKMSKIIQISEMERSNANACEGMKNELASTSFKVKENNPTPSTNFVNSLQANYYYSQKYNHQTQPNKGFDWSSDNVWNPPKPEVARPEINFQSIRRQIKDYQQRNYPNSGAFSLNSGVLRFKSNAPYASRNSLCKTANDCNIELVMLLIRDGKYRTMIILRGLPGSGKSYLAKYLASLDDHCIILSTDDFFNCNGKYVFNWTRLEAAHNWNQSRAKQAVLDGRGPIIIDNTNIEVWEMMPYVSMAKQFGYRLEILEPGTPWKFEVSTLADKNTHGVRNEKIAKMLAKYQYNIDANYFKKFDFKTDLNNDHKSVFDPKGRENGKQPILLEAVVHQEEQSSDALLEKQNKPSTLRCDTSSHEEASHSDKITSYDEYISLEVSKSGNFVEELPEQLQKNRESRPMQNCVENCLLWTEDEDFNNKPDLNTIFESENSCINQEKNQNEEDSLLNFGSPKPQRKNVNICVLPKKFIETEDVKADLVNLNDSFKAGDLKDWETNIENNEKNINNDRSSDDDKVSLMPKPPRVPVETQCKSETFNEIPKIGAKFDSRDGHNAPHKSQRQRSILSLPFIEKDWSFPEYVQNDILERKISSVDNISYSMSGTQTESEDFVLAYKIERKENYSSKYYILSSRNDQSNKKCGFNNHEMHLAVNIKKFLHLKRVLVPRLNST